ncbi:DUF4160 domain-containing protein [Flavobacterium restrictum]|uniref:DUF4160 domain-containing protein n=1 Tax=Flavobacterium restrictum TaxID=2594428 RepID=A0A553DUA5_9FLAO|nr:DUF4160 domain-containing protein [Flavobacterium restrictum]TRX36354.1 DUF4160 domain-containing protein [Flavobacterium restrictum]
MPTVITTAGFRFFFYSNEHLPKHIHVEKAEKTAKFNLEFVELIKSSRCNASELKQIRNLVEENQELLIQKWDEFFSN